MNLGGPEILILAVWVLPLAFGLWALIDANKHPAAAWEAAGKDRTAWIVLNAIGMLFCLVLPLVYVFAIRPGVVRAERGASS